MRKCFPSSASRNTRSNGIRRASPAGSRAETRPTATWVSRNVAFSEAMTSSVSAMKWSPPALQTPLTAVMTGFQQRFWSAVMWPYGADQRSPDTSFGLSPVASEVTSQPVQKAFSPAPVRIAQATSGFVSTSVQIRLSSRHISWSKALSAAGLSRVIVAMRSAVS